MVRSEPLRNQMRRNFVADADIQIEAFAGDIDETVEQIEPYAKLRMFVGEPRERRRHDMPAEPEAARYAQRPAWNTPRGGDVFHELIDIVEDLFGPGIDAFAGFRNRNAACGSMQQARAEIGFQHADSFADIRRRYRQRLRCPAETGLAGDHAKHAQVIEIRGWQCVHYSRFVHSGLTKNPILSGTQRNRIVTSNRLSISTR